MKSAKFPAILVLIVAAATEALAQPRPAGVPAGVRAVRDVEYARVDGNRPLRLDLYIPEKAAGPLPLVVWIHGGGWEKGSKNACPAILLCAKGFAAASIQYRLTDVAPFPAQIHDCKGAVRWLRANAAKYNLDPNRIGAWGASAGGHLVALLGTADGVKELEGTVGGNLEQSSAVQAVCDFCGPSDWTSLGDARLTPEAIGHVTKLLGGPPSEKKELAALASPAQHAGKGAAPFLVVHGDKDDLVPVSQAQALHDALTKAGADSTLRIVPGAGHNLGGPALVAEVAGFFAKHLGVTLPATRPAADRTGAPPRATTRPARD